MRASERGRSILCGPPGIATRTLETEIPVASAELVHRFRRRLDRVDRAAGGQRTRGRRPAIPSKSSSGSRATPASMRGSAEISSEPQQAAAYNCEGKPLDTGPTQKIAVDYYLEANRDGMTRLRLIQSGFGPEAA